MHRRIPIFSLKMFKLNSNCLANPGSKFKMSMLTRANKKVIKQKMKQIYSNAKRQHKSINNFYWLILNRISHMKFKPRSKLRTNKRLVLIIRQRSKSRKMIRMKRSRVLTRSRTRVSSSLRTPLQMRSPTGNGANNRVQKPAQNHSVLICQLVKTQMLKKISIMQSRIRWQLNIGGGVLYNPSLRLRLMLMILIAQSKYPT